MGLEAHQPFDCFRHPHRCQRHTSRKRQENVAENCAMPDYSVFSNRLRNLPIKKNVTRPRPIGVSVGTAHFFQIAYFNLIHLSYSFTSYRTYRRGILKLSAHYFSIIHIFLAKL